ncbi:LysM peptidoglycan-binding domain-containing protein [Cohnella zeiphila]|uniref:LysM peptidoglycan-binding domain-containing protein n=1 Tax=Cohnella zeiphila TaxID=2761120 RepID=A0A7X0VUK5_9BACL|nr:LysM peptidoglycan-binding domain-containing protein [Cohnella zeiphila]MBB6730357.1 LysM peptidoglycan-binding domain-containing protein [Cohnella zeiphila]
MVHAWVLGSGSELPERRNGHVENKKNKNGNAVAGGSPSLKSRQGWKSARLLFFAGALLLLFVGFSLMRTYADGAAPAAVGEGEKTVTAVSGDTLWGIASKVKRDGLDTREAVYRIMDRNNMSSSEIDSGERLVIPANVLP